MIGPFVIWSWHMYVQDIGKVNPTKCQCRQWRWMKRYPKACWPQWTKFYSHPALTKRTSWCWPKWPGIGLEQNTDVLLLQKSPKPQNNFYEPFTGARHLQQSTFVYCLFLFSIRSTFLANVLNIWHRWFRVMHDHLLIYLDSIANVFL